MRKVDIGVLVNLVTLVAMLWVFITHPVRWDNAAREIDELKPVVAAHATAIAVEQAHFDEIIRRLNSIDRKLGR